MKKTIVFIAVLLTFVFFVPTCYVQALDTTAPTTPTGLTAQAISSSQINLSWTASTDDVGVAGYKIYRCAGSACAPTVQISTSATNSYSNTGLTASTAYTYAVSAYDAAGNESGKSASASVTTLVANGNATVSNFVTIEETEGQSTTNYPVQLGRPFVQGEIANYPQALVDGIAVETQADVKSRWSDGSVKHAVISFLIPYLPANASIQVTFRNQPSGNNDRFLTKEMMLDLIYDFDAVMELENGGINTVSARDMLDAGAFTYWQKGPIATTVILADHSSARAFDTGFDAYRSVRPLFHVTFWPGIKKVKVRFIGEIANTEALQDQAYALTLKTGYQSPEIVYIKPLFTHYSNSRWAKVFWIGGEPSRVAIDHNLAYLAETRFIPNFDVRKNVSETAISDAYGQWSRASKDIFDPGNWTKYMPEPGGRPEIGMYPTWTVLWLYSGDRRMEEQALGNADLSAAWPIHFREGKEGKLFLRDNSTVSGLGRPVSVSDRPTINLKYLLFSLTTLEDKIVPVGPRSNGDWVPDNAHQPELVSPQYFLTGDYWYLEELYFWASWSAANTSGAAIDAPWGRGPTGAGGGIYGEVRAQAWMLKNRAHAAFVAPDDTPEKEYFTTLIHDAIAIFEGERNIQTTSFFGNANWNWGKSIKSPILGDPPLHHWHQGDLDMARQGEMDSSVTYAAVSTWNQNAMLMSLGRVKELGYPADALLSYLAFNLIGQLIHPDYNPYLVDTYRLPAKRLSDSRFFPTWGELKTGYTSEASSITSFSRLTDPEQGYVFVALAAASMVTDEPRGIEAWQFMAREALPASVLNDNPKWALVPRGSIAPLTDDITPPSIPANLQATAVSSSQINLSWSASTDNVGVTGYNIYRNGTKISTSPTNSYQDRGLFPATTYIYTISAFDAAGNTSVQSASVSATTLAPSDNPIDSLEPGHWYEVPNSALRNAGVLPDPLPPGPNIGPAGIMEAWSGGAFDTKRDRLLIWGGGHTAYAGNEIYAFDINSLQWSRIWGPTPNEQIQDPDLAPEVYLDGNPSARHTYDNLVYIPDPIDALWSSGGAPWGNAGWLTNATWQFNFGTLTWERKSKPQDDKSTIATDYDPVTGRVLFYGKYTLFEYNPANDSFKTLSPPRNSGWWNIGVGALDYDRRIFVAVGGGGLMMVNLTTGEHELNPPTTGGDAIINAYGPGFVYDSTSKQFVGWSGDGTGDELASVYTLNPETWQWTKHSPAPTNNVIPTKRNENGTYGRFRYIPSKNAFIVVNSIDENVYIYRLNPGGGTPIPTDTISPTIPTNLTVTPVSSSQINLSWNASTDDVGVTGYKIYRCAGSTCVPTTQIATSAANSYANTGLTASTAYTYAVSAYDAAGNESAQSASVSATTQASLSLTGDVNKDSFVDILDIQTLVNHILGIQDYGMSADVNIDGSVDVLDIQEVVNIILGV